MESSAKRWIQTPGVQWKYLDMTPCTSKILIFIRNKQSWISCWKHFQCKDFSEYILRQLIVCGEYIFRLNYPGKTQVDSPENILKLPIGYTENIFTWLQLVHLWPGSPDNNHTKGSFRKRSYAFIGLNTFLYLADSREYMFGFIIPGKTQLHSSEIIELTPGVQWIYICVTPCVSQTLWVPKCYLSDSF